MLRSTAIACFAALAVGFVLLRPGGGPESAQATSEGPALATAAATAPQSESGSTSDVRASGISRPEDVTADESAVAVVEPPAPPAVQPAAPQPEAPRRRYRRRYRNIYPGPIPTPADWQPPEGPVRIALQAGHWRAEEAPNELSGLKDNGTSSRGKAEWEANLEIAKRAATLLESHGYVVDVLPAVVPPSYRAHLFISIHADGSNDPRATGYRVAAPRRDATGRAGEIASLLERTYGEATGIRRLPVATRRMSNYYAFNFRRYRHALHPMTIAVILETGFLTSAEDWEVIVENPDRAARGIVEAVRAFDVTALPQGDLVATAQDQD